LNHNRYHNLKHAIIVPLRKTDGLFVFLFQKRFFKKIIFIFLKNNIFLIFLDHFNDRYQKKYILLKYYFNIFINKIILKNNSNPIQSNPIQL